MARSHAVDVGFPPLQSVPLSLGSPVLRANDTAADNDDVAALLVDEFSGSVVLLTERIPQFFTFLARGRQFAPGSHGDELVLGFRIQASLCDETHDKLSIGAGDFDRLTLVFRRHQMAFRTHLGK